jgi:dihydroflavonol-4-reductase
MENTVYLLTGAAGFLGSNVSRTLIARGQKVRALVLEGVARVLAFFAEAASQLTKKPAMFTGFSVYNLARNNNFSCEKAKRELGFHTRPFEQTIADTIEWLRAEGKISAAA